jgi:hypothetical protein
VFGGIAAGAFLFCIVGIGMSYFVVKKRYGDQGLSKRTLEIMEDVEIGNMKSSKDGNDLMLPSGDADDSSSSSSHDSSSDSEASSRKNIRQSKTKDRKDPKVQKSTGEYASLFESNNKKTKKSKRNASDSDSSDSSSSSSGGSDSSSSDSEDSSVDRKLKARVAERRMKRAESMKIQPSRRSSNDLTGLDKPEQHPSTNKGRDNWKKLSKSMVADSQKKDNWKTLSNSLKPEMPPSRRSSNDLTGLDKPDQQLETNKGRDNWKKLRKSMVADSQKKDNWKTLSNSLKPVMPPSRRSSNDLAGLNEPDQQLETNKGRDNWKKLSKSMVAGDINLPKPVSASQKQDNWKTLSNSLKPEMPPSRRSSNDLAGLDEPEQQLETNKGRDNWKKLSKSMVAGDINLPKPVSASQKQDNWKTLSNSLKADVQASDKRTKKPSQSSTSDYEGIPKGQRKNMNSDKLRGSESDIGRRTTRKTRNCNEFSSSMKPTRSIRKESPEDAPRKMRSRRSTSDLTDIDEHERSSDIRPRRSSDDLRQSRKSDLAGSMRQSTISKVPRRQGSKNQDDLRRSSTGKQEPRGERRRRSIKLDESDRSNDTPTRHASKPRRRASDDLRKSK